jgi:hypothetical protein
MEKNKTQKYSKSYEAKNTLSREYHIQIKFLDQNFDMNVKVTFTDYRLFRSII